MEVILSVSDEGYSRNTWCTLNLIYTFVLPSLGYNTAAGGQFISEGIIRSVVNTWFIRYNIISI